MEIFERLRKNGFRITPQRKQLLKVISENPLSAQEIFSILKKRRISIDLASVYRILDFFLHENLIKEVNFGDGKKRYEIAKSGNHHHHIVCNNCGDIEDIELKLENQMIQEIVDKTSFKVADHSLEFYGLCQKCL